MTATVNGKDLLTAELREGRVGAWTGEIDVDDEAGITGAVTIDVDGEVWHGSVIRGEVEASHFHAWIIGGKYGLSKFVDAKHYISAPCRLMLNEIIGISGETLSSASDSATLQKQFARWSRARGTVGSALAQLATDCSVSWRVLRDGTVWLGPETWPENEISYEELEYLPNRGRISIAPVTPAVKPGDTFADGKVSTVMTRVTPGGVRQDILYEDEKVGSADRVRQMLVDTIQSVVGQQILYSNWYPARVVSQASDGTVDLYPDDVRVRGSGISRVPLRHGLPGCTVKVKAGQRVCLFFENNDPKTPAAGLWPDGSSVSEITISAPTVRIEGNLVVTGEVTAMAASPGTSVSLSKHLHPTAVGPTSPPTPGT